MSFCAPFRESCPLFHVLPMLTVALSLCFRWPAQAYSMTTRWRDNRSSVGSRCTMGSSGPLGMMGKELVGRCMTDTCGHAHAGESLKACHSLDNQVWGTGYSACPCASRVRWVVSDETGPSTILLRWNLSPKSPVYCLLGYAGSKGGKSRRTGCYVVESLVPEVLLAPGGSGTGCLYRNALYRHVSLV